jgi:hypothetical protein
VAEVSTGFGADSMVAEAGSFQAIIPSCVRFCDGLRSGSGLNTAFKVTTLHVSSSSKGWPLLWVTWQSVTSPALSIVTMKPTAPSSRAASAFAG